MKYAVLVFLVMITVSIAAVTTAATSIKNNKVFSCSTVPIDKNLHSLAGFSIAILTSLILQQRLYHSLSVESLSSISFTGIVSGTIFGLFKEEIIDNYFGGDVEYSDFVYTSYGAVIGSAIFFSAFFVGNILELPSSFTNSMLSITALSTSFYLIRYTVLHGI